MLLGNSPVLFSVALAGFLIFVYKIFTHRLRGDVWGLLLLLVVGMCTGVIGCAHAGDSKKDGKSRKLM